MHILECITHQLSPKDNLYVEDSDRNLRPLTVILDLFLANMHFEDKNKCRIVHLQSHNHTDVSFKKLLATRYGHRLAVVEHDLIDSRRTIISRID